MFDTTQGTPQPSSPVRIAMRLMLAGLLLLALAGVSAPARAASDALRLTRAELLVVEGQGFSAPPYTQSSSTLAGSWQAVELPHTMPSQPVSQASPGLEHTVVTWYRAQVQGLGNTAGPRYLYVPRWKTDGQIAVYGDGRLLYQSHTNLLWNGSNHPLWIALDETAGAVAPREILIRIERLYATGGALSSLWVGSSQSLSWRYLARDWLQAQLPFMSSAAFLAVGVFSLLVWCRRRRETLYLLFFCVSAISFLRTMHYYAGQERLPVSDEWFGWMTVNSLFWLVATVHLFLVRLHRQQRPWLERVVLIVAAVVSLLTWPQLPALPNATLYAPLLYVLLLGMGGTAFALDLRSAWRVRSQEGLLLAGWSSLGMLLGAYDWLLQNNYVNIEGGFLGSYANIGAFAIFMFIMFRRYLGAIAGMEELNASLEARLKTREAELQASHERLREAEQQRTLASERQRLMQDMHDGLGSSLRSALWAVERGQIGSAAIAEVLKSCIDDLKLTIDSMEPVQADLLLLLATLRYRLGSRLESTGLELSWEITEVPPLPWLAPRSSLHILRILQEVFTNVIKHTQATRIRLATSVVGDGVEVRVTDNGQGFDVAAAQRDSAGGRGLGNQLRRAQGIGGRIAWVSGAQGTQVILWLPLAMAPHDAAEVAPPLAELPTATAE